MEILSDAIFKGNVLIKKSLVVSKSITEFRDDDSASFFGEAYFYCGFKTNEESFIGGNLNVGCRQLLSTSSVGFGYGKFAAYNDVELGNDGCGSNTKIHGNLLLCLASNTIDFRGNSITFPSTAGTLALTSQIPSLTGYLTTSAASSTYLSKTDASSTYLSKTDASSTYQKKFTTFSSPSIPANCTAFEFTGTAISDTNKTHLIQVQNTSTGKSVIAETWMTSNKKPAMSFAGCTSTVAAGTYTAIVL